MTTKRIRSRILEHFTPQLLTDLYRVCKSSIISDNNLKVDTMLNILNEYKIDYVELGPGTNRLAILIDNYVFKLALDKWGLQDNINEFTVSQELQPHVVKTYETNDLISVCEYVTVISKDEFIDNKETIRDILGILAEGYLLGDVGTVAKNFCNWGYRDNGDLVILDFAYIYRIQGEEMLCSQDQTMLEYDENFYNLKCPTCGKKHSFMDVRRKIPMEYELNENMMARQLSYKLTKEVETVKDRYTEEEELPAESSNSLYKENIEPQTEEGFTMKHDKFISKDDHEESYLEAMKSLRVNRTPDNIVLGVDMGNDDHIKTQTIDIEKRTPDSFTHIRVFKQEVDGDAENITSEDFLKEVISEIHEAENEVQTQISLGEIVEVETEEIAVEEFKYEDNPEDHVTMEQTPRYSTAPYVEDPQNRTYSADEEEDEYLKGLEFVKSHQVEIDDEEDDNFEPNASIHIHAKDADIEIHPDGSVELHADEIEVSGVELSGDTDGDYEEEAFNKDFIDGSNSDDEEFEEKQEDMDENPEFYDRETEETYVVKAEDVEMVVTQDTTEAVVIDHTVHLSDTLAIKSVVTVESTNTDEETLRAELANDLMSSDAEDEMAATFDEEKVDGVAAQYMHLQYEAEEEENARRNRNKKDWK